jgi:hypothetical protein
MSIGRQAVRRIAARVGRIDQSGSPRLRQISFNRHFALATPCAHVPGCSAEPSNFKIGIAHPWSWAIGSSTSAAQRSLLFDVVAILPSKEGATRLAAVSAARDFILDAVTNHMFTKYVNAAMPLHEPHRHLSDRKASEHRCGDRLLCLRHVGPGVLFEFAQTEG